MRLQQRRAIIVIIKVARNGGLLVVAPQLVSRWFSKGGVLRFASELLTHGLSSRIAPFVRAIDEIFRLACQVRGPNCRRQVSYGRIIGVQADTIAVAPQTNVLISVTNTILRRPPIWTYLPFKSMQVNFSCTQSSLFYFRLLLVFRFRITFLINIYSFFGGRLASSSYSILQ